MNELLIINASPRNTHSNSKQYGQLLKQFITSEYLEIMKTNHEQICQNITQYKNIVFVFPLYVDALPATFLDFLKTLEKYHFETKPVVSVIINCGFLEPEQNDVAIEMVKLFCLQNKYSFGSVLKIGGGEAILKTPFKCLVKHKIKKLAHSIKAKKYCQLKVTMPISKKMYLKASTNYWLNYGKGNNLTKDKMATMKIEDK